MKQTAEPIDARLFDGRNARARPVRVSIDGRDLLMTCAEEGSGSLRVPVNRVQWPERTRHGVPVVHLPDGGSLCRDESMAGSDWRRWLGEAGATPSLVVRAQQSWRGTLIALLLLVLAACAGYRWGVPLAVDAVLLAVPPSVDTQIGQLVLSSLQKRGWLEPSQLPPERQEALRQAFALALHRSESAQPGSTPDIWSLQFTASQAIGANAFALPGGTIVVTDRLAALLDGRDDVMLGVVGHEAGHLQERHGMRLLLRSTLVAMATSIAFGDFSNVAAAAPALLANLAYSRDFEREADEHAIALMLANRIPPTVMAVFFERVRKQADAPDRETFGIGLASHPPDEERLRAFERAASPQKGD